MLKRLKQIFTGRAARNHLQVERDMIEAWSLHFGREGAELWIEALSTRDAVRLSNA